MRTDNNMADGGRHGVSLHHLGSAGLLPTPRVGGEEGYDTRNARQGHEKAISYLEANVEWRLRNGMLPTPTTSDGVQNASSPTVTDGNTKGKKHGVNLKGAVRNHLLPTITTETGRKSDFAQGDKSLWTAQGENGMLPTPRESEWKGVGPLGSDSHEHMLGRGYLGAVVQEKMGMTIQISPFFVEEMMGFPLGWTLAPFVKDEHAFVPDDATVDHWANFPQQHPLMMPDAAFEAMMDEEKMGMTNKGTQPMRLSGRWRKHSLMGYGNAIVWQCFFPIADAINKVEDEKRRHETAHR